MHTRARDASDEASLVILATAQAIPSQQGKLQTETFFPENYLEIGNGLPTRKNSVWELFGSVTGIKPVIIQLAGNALFGN